MNTDQTFREATRWARAHKGALAAAAAAVLGLGATSVVADTGGVPEALHQVRATVNTLIATVNQLTIKVDQLPKAARAGRPCTRARSLHKPVRASPAA
jgi:outer membrane murein-binding lipoprotein Lpp